jgi:hypothetical protein
MRKAHIYIEQAIASLNQADLVLSNEIVTLENRIEKLSSDLRTMIARADSAERVCQYIQTCFTTHSQPDKLIIERLIAAWKEKAIHD